MKTLASKEKKGITVKVDTELHAEIKQYIENHEMTMADFVTQALRDELHPRISAKEDKYMGNMRTMAFQVPEELFQKIKDYLQRNNMTQKQFVIGLIENEIERDLTQRADVSEAPTDSERVSEEHAEQQETAAVSDCESVSEEVGKVVEEQNNDAVSNDFEVKDIDENEELGVDQEESDGMAMGM